MPIYPFRSESGEYVDLFFPMGDAPHLGEWITLEGVAMQRVIEAPQLANSKGGMTTGPIVSEGAPNRKMVEHWEREARKFGLPMPARATAYDDVGRAVFRNSHELEDYCKRDGRFVMGNPREAFQDAASAPARHQAKVERVLRKTDEQLTPEVL